MTANILTFPGQFRPHVVEPAERETDRFTLARLTEAAEAANAAALDCAGSIRFILSGNDLAESSHVLSGETLTSLLQAALAVIALRGSRNADLTVSRAICAWLENSGGHHG